MGSAGWSVLRWAMDDAPTVRTKKGAADTAAHAVLTALAGFAGKDARARPSLGTLADRARLTERATAAALGKLTAAGLIEPAGAWGTVPVWRLCTDVVRSDEDAAEGERRREAARESARRRQQASRATRHAVGQRDVTSPDGVTEVERHAVGQRESHPPTTDVTPSTPSQPPVSDGVTALGLPSNCQDGADTSAPAPSKGKSKRQRRRPSTPMPEGWRPTEEHRKRAAALGLVLAVEADEFRAWTGAKDARYADWDLAFTNHLIGNGKRAASRGNRPPVAPTARPSGHDEAQDWLRAEWAAGRVTRITALTGLTYIEGNLPPGHTAAEARAWHFEHRRAWIAAHREQILAKVTTEAS